MRKSLSHMQEKELLTVEVENPRILEMAVEFLEHRTINICPNATRTLGSSKTVFGNFRENMAFTQKSFIEQNCRTSKVKVDTS